jgi:citrate synthase
LPIENQKSSIENFTMNQASLQVHKGLEGVIASETQISDVDGTRCQLIYRGYSIDELAGHATYEEVSYLLLYGHLPTAQELTAWSRELASRRALEPQILQAMQHIPFGNPMAYLRSVISIMGLADSRAEDGNAQTMREQAMDLIAKTPTIIATFDRLRAKRPMLGPRQDLGHAANFLFLLHGEEPSPEHVESMDSYFVLLAEHGFNASTFAARTAISTQTDLYSAIVAAIGTLKGPLHGAANAKTMETLMEIGAPEGVEPFVQKTLADHKRFMGFGHRVYKGEDPRAKHLKRLAGELSTGSKEPRWFQISERLREAVWKAKQLSINVDFYSASLLYYLGIPVDLFTTMFACARMAGWSAHILEQAQERLIRPLALYVGPRDLRFIPIDQRSPSTASV